ncbi:SDR family oxidoreductase [Bombilactobacillus thymidiniphilus]|uniref:SDR family oxidoreductase n=1 Tax=Bombilactobacillus thymidiniphilus TaxID=2923363 RepID=A0ABY4PC45_9LACO|nr:SDR family oxidoreductase [Bombilactobacillus thymidiniphilus]UQS83329.1 SDR family oxidoreductase [Bombilactobacillus thymidiniphilus]
MMRVLVIGAHGKIGFQVVNALQKRSEYQVVAGLRALTQVQDYQNKNYQARFLDLEGSLADLTNTMADIEAVVFSAGSGGETGADKTMMIDLDGAVKAIEAAKLAGVKRFIMVSAIKADERSFWSYKQNDLAVGNYYYAAKYYADQWLQNSGLAYTIIRPAVLTDAQPTGKIDLATQLTLKKNEHVRTITRSDVAQLIVVALDNPVSIGQAFDVSNGDLPMNEVMLNF